MSRAHVSGLHFDDDGAVRIQTQYDFDRLLGCPVRDLSSELVIFTDERWLDRGDEERTAIASFLNSARERVCGEERLPSPRTELPAIGTRVEALHGGKPNPERRWALGSTTGVEWIPVTRDWRVQVTFDHPNGFWCGQAIRGATTTPRFIYVVGDPTRRAWSSMGSDEIDGWLENRRQY